MSGHGRSILGATFRRTCGITFSSITTRQRLYSPRLAIPFGPCDTSQVTKAAPYQQSYLTNNFHTPFPYAATSTRIIWARALVSFPKGTKCRVQQKWNPQVIPPCQHDHAKGLRSPWLMEVNTYIQRRSYGDKSAEPHGRASTEDNATPRSHSESTASSKATEFFKVAPGSKASKHLIDRLPSIPQVHKPSKEELLAAATGFWSRLKVRFKWFSIRSGRPFNVDEISAFFSWVLLGHVIWIVLGTTTFFSLAILAVNTVFAQGWPFSDPRPSG